MRRLPYRSVLGVAVAVAVFLLLLRFTVGGTRVARAIDDLGELFAAAIASLAAGYRSRHTAPDAVRSWTLLSAGTGAWALGQAVWSYYELLANRQTPFPSFADAGFLLFPVLAVIGVWLWPSVALRGVAGWRSLLDGTLVAGSLFIVSWVTALGAAVHGGGSSLDWVVSVSYPVTDLVLITLTVIVVAHAPADSRAGLGVLAAGLVFLCVGDSGFAYLTSVGRYATGSPVDAGWFGGFLLIAVVAILLARQLLAVLENRKLVTQLTHTQQELRHQAFHDPLTGLANRALFADRLRHGLELHQRDLRPLSLLYCDLDGFKVINDTLGHENGDEVIKIAAERLRAVTRTADTVARLGGDEFAILLEHGEVEAPAIVRHILDAFTQPTYVGGRIVATFLHREDAAMYRAKRSGTGGAMTWSPSTDLDPPAPPSNVSEELEVPART